MDRTSIDHQLRAVQALLEGRPYDTDAVTDPRVRAIVNAAGELHPLDLDDEEDLVSAVLHVLEGDPDTGQDSPGWRILRGV